jgi:hypothetical protein
MRLGAVSCRIRCPEESSRTSHGSGFIRGFRPGNRGAVGRQPTIAASRVGEGSGVPGRPGGLCPSALVRGAPSPVASATGREPVSSSDAGRSCRRRPMALASGMGRATWSRAPSSGPTRTWLGHKRGPGSRRLRAQPGWLPHPYRPRPPTLGGQPRGPTSGWLGNHPSVRD